MSKVIVVESWKRHAKVGVTQSFDAGITTIGVEMVVASNINVVRKEVLIGFATKLDSGSCGVSTIRNLSQSLALSIAITGVIDIPQMVFTNSITTTHVNRIIDQPLMNSLFVRRYKSTDVAHPKGGYQEPITITIPIFYHKDGHYVRPNMVVLKYLDFKKDVDLNVHVRVLNSVVKTNT
jgi:hypothetical protein